MKEYFSNIGLEVTLTALGLLATFLGWLVGRLTTYKKKIVAQTLSDVEVDARQDSKITHMESKIETLEKVISRLQRELDQLKGEQDRLESKLFGHLDRVETKIDKVYEIIVSKNG